ncbi:hypothetical protein ACLD0U_08205 [Microbacterium sp. 2216-1]|uniref:hypothetical protein n=1 Tax=Microbacterium sp. 2216-1 TaxID=3390053 RepID=UPI003975BE46
MTLLLPPKELAAKYGITVKGWTNIVLLQEADRRGLGITKNEEKGFYYLTSAKGTKFAWRNGYTNWNTILSQRVAQHKDVSSRILAAYGVPSTENQVFGEREAGRAWLWAEPLGPLVVKPANGIMGKNVHVGINTREQFLQAYDDVAKARNGRVLVEKYYSGVEHRCFVVNGKLVGVTRRRPASVLGDGVSTVAELVSEKNRDRGRIHIQLQLDDVAHDLLAENDLSRGSIPAAGERIYLRRASNLHQGGDAIDATDDLSPDEVAIAEATARAIPGARSFGMDLLLPRNPGDDPPRVLEINTDPMVSMHHFPWEGEPRDVASAIIDGMFPSTRSD